MDSLTTCCDSDLKVKQLGSILVRLQEFYFEPRTWNKEI